MPRASDAECADAENAVLLGHNSLDEGVSHAGLHEEPVIIYNLITSKAVPELVEKLVTDGQLDVSKKVQEYIPDFKDQEGDKILGKNDLTVREILEHQAGFPPDPQYHNRNYNPEKPEDPQPNANQKLYSQNRDEILQKIIETPLQYVPGTKTAYSDVDYMLLGFIIEKITKIFLRRSSATLSKTLTSSPKKRSR